MNFAVNQHIHFWKKLKHSIRVDFIQKVQRTIDSSPKNLICQIFQKENYLSQIKMWYWRILVCFGFEQKNTSFTELEFYTFFTWSKNWFPHTILFRNLIHWLCPQLGILDENPSSRNQHNLIRALHLARSVLGFAYGANFDDITYPHKDPDNWI